MTRSDTKSFFVRVISCDFVGRLILHQNEPLFSAVARDSLRPKLNWQSAFGNRQCFSPPPALRKCLAGGPGRTATYYAPRESCRDPDLQLPAHPDRAAPQPQTARADHRNNFDRKTRRYP